MILVSAQQLGLPCLQRYSIIREAVKDCDMIRNVGWDLTNQGKLKQYARVLREPDPTHRGMPDFYIIILVIPVNLFTLMWAWNYEKYLRDNNLTNAGTYKMLDEEHDHQWWMEVKQRLVY